jgi:hypothetical protein
LFGFFRLANRLVDHGMEFLHVLAGWNQARKGMAIGIVIENRNQQSFSEIWRGERYREFRRSLVHDRKNLAGCKTCSRNDDRRLEQLEHFKILL